MKQDSIRVMIVDDHKLLRETWVRLLSSEQGITIVGEAGDVETAIAKVTELRPDVLILDINLQGSSGIDAVPKLRKISPGTRIIAATSHNELAYVKKMMQLGAAGYVTKNSSGTEMLEAIEAVMQGKKYLCTEVKDLLASQVIHGDPDMPGVQHLSIREKEIISMIRDGDSSNEIGVALNISARTVEVHRRNILKKLDLRNTASLINYINKTDLL